MQLSALRLVALVAVAIAAFVFYLASLVISATPAAAGLLGG